MHKITKSSYVEYAMCPKKAWFNIFEPIKSSSDESERALEGIKIGILARDYFGKNKCVMYDKNNPQKSQGIYAEYLLEYNNLMCYCDILKINEDNSVDIFEVKAVNDDNKKKFLEDISFQYYVAIRLGLRVNSVNLLSLNSEYVYDGQNLELDKLFKVSNYTDEVVNRLDIVKENISAYLSLAKNSDINFALSSWCKANEGCQYFNCCKKIKNLPLKNSTWELYDCKTKNKYIEEGFLSWNDFYESKYWDKLSDYNKIMIDYYVNKKEDIFVRTEKLKAFLARVKFPIFFFDFETTQEAIPVYPNSRPYAQIPFQYSLHIMRSKDETEADILKNHKEYLGDGEDDPREDLIIQMLNDLENEGTIIAYHQPFEISRIRELANDFPKYKTRLLKLVDRFMDLEDVFHFKNPVKKYITKGPNKGTYKDDYEPAITLVYHSSMENSCSIKRVLPSFIPNRADLDYKNLEDVHKGDEASAAYKKLKELSKEEKARLRSNMLKYCCLDTKAMVVLYLKFIELTTI